MEASTEIVGIVAGPLVPRQPSTVALDFVTSRKLSPATLAQLNVGCATAFFPDLKRDSLCLKFHYQQGWKARAVPEKSFRAGPDRDGNPFKLSFWNIGRVLAANPDTVWITEGEMDCCALVEAGIPADAVLSVPNGAKQRPADDPKEQRGYDYVREALAAGLNRVKRVVWCGDGDDQGRALREDMVKLLGAARFFFIEWPDGCKDANNVLIHDGSQFLYEMATEGSLPWPVQGIYRLSELPEPAPMTLWNPGFPEWESKVMLAPRTMSVVTGHPGCGKTLLFNQLWFNVVHQYGIPACVASFETEPKPHLRRQLRTLLLHKLERDMSSEEMRRADEWINDRYTFLVHPESRPTLEWFLDMAEVAVVRYGARIIQIDPWNRLEAARAPNENEPDYIARCLRTIHTFAHDMNVHMQIIAHPAKMDSARRGSPPMLEDIAGAKHWDNMVDQGFVVHRKKFDQQSGARLTEAELTHAKSRFEELGYACQLKLNYLLEQGRYVSVDYSKT